MPQTIEQERARSAWKDVESASAQAAFTKYSQLLQGLPVAIHTAGLGQTVAFYRAKGQQEHKLALAHLAGWLLRNDVQNPAQRTDSALMKAIHEGSSDDYRRLTAETHAYLAWLKRFAAAKAPDKAPGEAS